MGSKFQHQAGLNMSKLVDSTQEWEAIMAHVTSAGGFVGPITLKDVPGEACYAETRSGLVDGTCYCRGGERTFPDGGCRGPPVIHPHA